MDIWFWLYTPLQDAMHSWKWDLVIFAIAQRTFQERSVQLLFIGRKCGQTNRNWLSRDFKWAFSIVENAKINGKCGQTWTPTSSVRSAFGQIIITTNPRTCFVQRLHFFNTCFLTKFPLANDSERMTVKVHGMAGIEGNTFVHHN